MTAMDFVPALALLAILAREMLWVSGVAILLSGLDDLAMDTAWLLLVVPRKDAPLPPEPAVPGRFAILVPAWDEAEVIGAMLANCLNSLDHPDYLILVGVYPNDPATLAAVEAVGDARVRPVITSAPGPTSKADCLNHLWRGMMTEEAQDGRRFKAVVLHDAEDVVDPLELRLFDRLLPGHALVQIPVLPLVDRASPMIAGHYIDEFAESHARDMMVRARLDAAVPSAGVGTAFARDALARLAGPHQAPFNAASLTEDYEIAHRLHALGLKGHMVRHRVEGRLVANRAYFPDTLEAAVRQKSRWLTGIALNGWDQMGWPGTLAQRWMLLRDRKGLLTSAIAVLAYAAAVLVLALLATRALVAETASVALPPLLAGPGDRLLVILLALNTLILAWRVLMRAGFTAAAYGPLQGLLAIPRAVAGNLVNALAALRAVERYRTTLALGQPPAWDKTAHRFPTAIPMPRHG
jgi:adsorption protein B